MEESTKIIRELERYLREIIEDVSPIVVVYLFGYYGWASGTSIGILVNK